MEKQPTFKNHEQHPTKLPERCPVCGSTRIEAWDHNYKYIFPERFSGVGKTTIDVDPGWFRCLDCSNRCECTRDTLFDTDMNVLCVDSSFQLTLEHIDVVGGR